MLLKTYLAAISGAAILAGTASAATIDFTVSPVVVDSSTGARTYDLGNGLEVVVTGGTLDDTGGSITTVDNSIVDFSDDGFTGLGVDTAGGDDLTIDSLDSTDGSNEFIQLAFNRSIVFNGFTVGKADRLDDVTVLNGGDFLFRVGTKLTPDDTGTNEFAFDIPVDAVGQTFIIAAGQLGNNSEGSSGTRNDDFILSGLDTSEVPLPGAALLFGSAFAGVLARRQRA